MHITLSPRIPHAHEPWIDSEIHVAGDTITIDGTPYDLSVVPEGGEATDTGENSPFSGKITRQDGVLHVTVIVRLGDDAADDQGPDPWVIPNASGDVAIPAIRKPVPEQEDAE